MIVHLAESSKKELVWRATIVEMLRDAPEKNVELTDEGVARAFENYPRVMKK